MNISEDLPSGILYINNALASRGLLPDENQRILHFNSSDSHEVIKIIYSLLNKGDKDIAIHEDSLKKLKEIQAQNEKYSYQLNNTKSKLEEAEREINSLKKKLNYLNKELSAALIEKKSTKDYISKIKSSIVYMKSQYANDLRKRDQQLLRLKEYLLGSELSKRNKNLSTMQIQKNPTLHKGPICTPSLVIEDTTVTEKLSEEAFSNLLLFSQKVSNVNIQLNNIIFQVLSDLDYLIGTKEESEPLFSSSSSPTILEAQLQIRLKLLSDIVFRSNNAPLVKTEAKDQEIYFLKQEIQKLNSNWEETKEFLGNFQKSLFGNKDNYVKEWEDQIDKNISNENISPILQEQERGLINNYKLLSLEEDKMEPFFNNSKNAINTNILSFQRENALQQELEEVLGLLPKTPMQK
ncbi:hypothetical protein T552_00633 [Pneumocystis carinii B80]|uniref:Uncharacterized protein n=1 Tax=Pneumocystis carinii (strain B80) TaxID=1408658 RepID=A0A0W4ZP78_PNEC8|nr:hypothetical protein T552_00633 [Pneumocystis carinii B80]KTW30155.1 hypothetical protein T552_00633 [Pneumocystis carinii B80]